MAAAAAGPSRHWLPPAALARAGELMAFNWLIAAYAHPDWLGPWAELLEPRGQASVVLLRRVSIVSIERHHLGDRFLVHADDCPWVLLSAQAVQPLAEELGVAMLGGWVQAGLEREQVARQLRVLGPQRRQRALRHGSELTSLPFPEDGENWPIELIGPASVARLGLSCIAALLLHGDANGGTRQGRDSGARERFAMRFPMGSIVPLRLTRAQREEARALIHRLVQSTGLEVSA